MVVLFSSQWQVSNHGSHCTGQSVLSILGACRRGSAQWILPRNASKNELNLLPDLGNIDPIAIHKIPPLHLCQNTSSPLGALQAIHFPALEANPRPPSPGAADLTSKLLLHHRVLAAQRLGCLGPRPAQEVRLAASALVMRISRFQATRWRGHLQKVLNKYMESRVQVSLMTT